MISAYFLFERSARHQTKNLDAAIAQLGGDAPRRHDLVNRARELHQAQDAPSVAVQIAELQKQANNLKSRIALTEKDSAEIAILQKQLANTNAGLQRIEGNADAAEYVISSYERSVCLLHVSVGFRETESGRWLRYAGLDPQGKPIRDNPAACRVLNSRRRRVRGAERHFRHSSFRCRTPRAGPSRMVRVAEPWQEINSGA